MKLLKIAPYAFIACFAVAVDQITKRAVLGAIGIGGRPVAVIDGFFYITCHRNSGAAFGMLQNGRPLLLVLTTAALIAIPIFMHRMRDAFARVALSFVMGGAIGNYIDRLAGQGGVVDFLDF
ncbi:MAG: signal peptidase II, partial [Clostridiales bacterium]|nr:signal peptidase II [Clostridiales bacterium]